MIRPTPPVTDPKIIAEILHELEFGTPDTPDTPERIATMKRADEAFSRTMRDGVFDRPWEKR